LLQQARSIYEARPECAAETVDPFREKQLTQYAPSLRPVRAKRGIELVTIFA
jgi:hypothetical protein